jgi:hypothetical protein
MIRGGAGADDLVGMHVTTAPEPGRGRAAARLHTDLQALARLDPDRPTAAERLEEALGPDLARMLVFALSRGGRVRAAAAA